MYTITLESYLDTLSGQYNKLFVISKMPSAPLNAKCMRITRTKISPFQENESGCMIVFRGENNQPLLFDQMDQLIHILHEAEYKIDYQLTKLMQKSRQTSQNLLFYIHKIDNK